MPGNKNSGRKKKPVAEKKLAGTFRKDRHAEQEQAENLLNEICCINENAVIACPESITDKTAIDFWNNQTRFLIDCRILKPQDLPLFESLCKDLEMLREITGKLSELEISDPTSEQVDILLKRKSRLENSYNSKCVKFFVSPADRAKLALDSLDIERKQQENQSAISRIIARNSVDG